MEISEFDRKDINVGRRVGVTWDALVVTLRKPAPRPEGDNDEVKAALRVWSPATFEGDKRGGANVQAVSCLVYDVDEEPIPSLMEISRHFSEKGIQWFAHSTSSSLMDAPRWRLLVALSRPLTAEEHALAWRAMADELPFRVGAASKDAARIWFQPCVGADGSFECGG